MNTVDVIIVCHGCGFEMELDGTCDSPVCQPGDNEMKKQHLSASVRPAATVRPKPASVAAISRSVPVGSIASQPCDSPARRIHARSKTSDTKQGRREDGLRPGASRIGSGEK